MKTTHRTLLSLLAGGSLLATGLAFASSDDRDGDGRLPADALPLGEIAAQLEADDYRVLAIEPDDRRYEVEVLDREGQLWEMELDPRTGEILDQDRDDRDDRYERKDRDRDERYERGDRDRDDRPGRGNGDQRGGPSRHEGPRAAGLPASAILADMESRGYRVLEIERYRGVYELEMRNEDGFEVEAYLDARTGEVLR